MTGTDWTLSDAERTALGAVLDALLPPSGSFPWPSHTGIIDQFILKRVPLDDAQGRLYPGLDAPGLKSLLAELAAASDVTTALSTLEQEQPRLFRSLWGLAVYGYYAQPETIEAIQRDLAPAYHGAPLPLGYAHAIDRWDPSDPLQRPRQPRGSFIPTDQVRRVEAPWQHEGEETA